ncbi:PAS domain S-box protein [Aeromonas caviae]|uniref:PAS domain S-box protein n=1 Tax=Aeromonas caviae TaxID=648 RepID=UPI002447D6A8|nr:PAS domain S-box protein [Aeromonas caviae]MDH1451640.1 PAS domain S-box protein [Aeromonas caviae]MDH1455734.1 PAS domain S-box protein [Aeromonas caviae]MDH1497255.1 PAS domain S-box protein [Aeromonas caviae]
MKSIIRLLCLISISTLLIFFSEIAVAITAETPEQTSFNFYDWAYVLTEIIFGLLVIAITLAGYVFYQNRKLKAELSKSQQHEDRLRTLYTAIEQSPVSVVIAGVDAYIRYVNPQFTAVTGYSPIEVIGQNPRILREGANKSYGTRAFTGNPLILND